jgi:hypothetical protein
MNNLNYFNFTHNLNMQQQLSPSNTHEMEGEA